MGDFPVSCRSTFETERSLVKGRILPYDTNDALERPNTHPGSVLAGMGPLKAAKVPR